MGGGYSVLVNYQSLLSNFRLLAPLIISFFIKYRRNRLLLESFYCTTGIEFYFLSLLSAGQVQNSLKFCNFGLNFVSDLAQVRGNKIHCLL